MRDFIVKYWLQEVFGLILAGLAAAYGLLAKRVKEAKAREQATAEGVKLLLMFQLREQGEKYVSEGHCDTEKKHEYEKAYNAYHALGGNDTITSLKETVLKLPPA